jgi:hypothetical protein
MVLGVKTYTMILLQQNVDHFEKQGSPTERLLPLATWLSGVKRPVPLSLCREKRPKAVQRCIVVLGEQVEVFCSKPPSNSPYVEMNMVGQGG